MELYWSSVFPRGKKKEKGKKVTWTESGKKKSLFSGKKKGGKTWPYGHGGRKGSTPRKKKTPKRPSPALTSRHCEVGKKRKKPFSSIRKVEKKKREREKGERSPPEPFVSRKVPANEPTAGVRGGGGGNPSSSCFSSRGEKTWKNSRETD